MSLILDALRKSEAERRRGQAPDLFATTPGAPRLRAERPRVWPLLVLAAMLLGAAWLIWSAGKQAVPEAPPEAAPKAEPTGRAETPADVATPALSPSTRGPVQAPARASVVTPAVVPVAPPPPDAPPASPAPRDGNPVAGAATRHDFTAPTPPLDAPAPEPRVEEPALPPLAVLDATTRAALPPLKLSMHVYAEDPARRFAIIDGQRVSEGSTVGSGVVAQIRRDGVVVEIDGRRVLVPKP